MSLKDRAAGGHHRGRRIIDQAQDAYPHLVDELKALLEDPRVPHTEVRKALAEETEELGHCYEVPLACIRAIRRGEQPAYRPRP